MICRRFGHNEIDEPMFTQPTMYSIIKKHPNVLDIYGKKLVRLTTMKVSLNLTTFMMAGGRGRGD